MSAPVPNRLARDSIIHFSREALGTGKAGAKS